ncbi:MAG TPA: hypothetical protein DD723_09760 [Candidatus Omnitrophica bacterium]|nr:hypothetical protein [Candidatus Omnitrophota bacterium]
MAPSFDEAGFLEEINIQEFIRSSGKDLDEYFVQAVLLGQVVQRILGRRGGIQLSRKPTFELKPVIEFMKRMRVSGLEKFDSATYISSINFYKNDEERHKHQAVGAIVIYFGEDYIVNILKKLDYPVTDDDDSETLEDACGAFCNLVAGNFKSGLLQLGYPELVMSHFSSYRNEVLDGVEYGHEQRQKYEINFEIKGQKSIVADLVMDKIHGFAADDGERIG